MINAFDSDDDDDSCEVYILAMVYIIENYNVTLKEVVEVVVVVVCF
jgi:hypothetical protein